MSDWFLICPFCTEYAAKRGEKSPRKWAIIWKSDSWFDKFFKEHGAVDTAFGVRWAAVLVNHIREAHNQAFPSLPRLTADQTAALIVNHKDMEGPL